VRVIVGVIWWFDLYAINLYNSISKEMKPITPREKEILYLIAHEHSSKEIAHQLYVSCETVNTHRKNIMIKLDVKNTAGMIRVAFERNLLPLSSLSLTA